MTAVEERAPGMVVTETELAARVRADRAAGRTVAFANGCFDVLHAGHARYLAGAAALADRLVVAVNDDASVAALKGPGRPVQTAADRAELLAAFAVVDYVVVFGDRTAGRLLALIEPDLHCKGPDYAVDTVPERDVVRAWGGRTVIVGGGKDHSTRDLVARIRKLPAPTPQPPVVKPRVAPRAARRPPDKA